MELSPLVSVVVPAYCHAEFIEDCLRSIHAQTYPEIELIVVDDLSTDDTFARAEALLQGDFAARFRRVALLRNERNLGAHDAINRGISESQGSYIALINSDDLYHPDRVSALMAALSETGAELGFSLVEVMTKRDEVHSIEPYFQLFAPRQMLALQRDPSIGFALMRLNVAISKGNLLFSRQLYDRIGRFSPMKYCHDWDFLLQALWWTEPVVVPQEHYRYRLHGTNSFSSLGYLASTEIEAVLCRFSRLGLRGVSPNRQFPCEFNWPGVFELYVRQCGHLRFLDRERGKMNIASVP
ncbi:glycosyltransferase family A protein [Pararhodobacter sp. CCB-MM2]|uniref:glycosyltransferase family 2 protein n=1 Tax=Pararhodobacter sp. CCB-MM2 TaxID=1786003 RepID=UPI00082BE57D|nr:glycosyltransferase family A protein [Pararhodobacter sp. CCB-MM2]